MSGPKVMMLHLLFIASLYPVIAVEKWRQQHFTEVPEVINEGSVVVEDVQLPASVGSITTIAPPPGAAVVLLQVFDRSNIDNEHDSSDVDKHQPETVHVRRLRRHHHTETGSGSHAFRDGSNEDPTSFDVNSKRTDKTSKTGPEASPSAGSAVSGTLHLHDKPPWRTVSSPRSIDTSNNGATVEWSDCRQLDLSKASAVLSASSDDDGVTLNGNRDEDRADIHASVKMNTTVKSKLIDELRRRLSSNRTIVLCKPELRPKSRPSKVGIGSGERFPVDLATRRNSSTFSRESRISTAYASEKPVSHDHRRHDVDTGKSEPGADFGRAKADLGQQIDNNRQLNDSANDGVTAKSVEIAGDQPHRNLTSPTTSDKQVKFSSSPVTADESTSAPTLVRHHGHSHHRLRHGRAFRADSHAIHRAAGSDVSGGGSRHSKPDSEQISCEFGGKDHSFNISNYLNHVKRTLRSYGCWNDEAKRLAADLERLSVSFSSSSSTASFLSNPETVAKPGAADGRSKNYDDHSPRQLACYIRHHYDKCIKDSRARRAARIWRGIKEGRGWPGAYESSWPRQVYDVRGSDEETSMIFY